MTDTELQAEVERLTDRLAKAEAVVDAGRVLGVACHDSLPYACWYRVSGAAASLGAALAAYDTAPRN